LKPDVNESFGNFTCVKKDGKDAIRFGLNSIKNFGEGIAQAIIDEREAQGSYTSLADFLTRIHNRNLNKKSLESLVRCGALDSFEYKRGRMHTYLDELLIFNREQGQEVAQGSLFGSGAGTLTLPECEQASMRDMLTWEKELLGLYVSGHPLDEHKERLKNFGTIEEVKKQYVGIEVSVAGILTEVKPFTTKKGDRMAFLKLSDYESTIEAVAFPRTYTEYREVLQPDTCVAFKGKLNERNGEKSFLVDKAKRL
jgi:DNA polymerase-3 subunit alpha